MRPFERLGGLIDGILALAVLLFIALPVVVISLPVVALFGIVKHWRKSS